MARVLIVDDDRADRIILGKIVKRAGHEVCFASGAEQALKIHMKGGIDVIVTDLRMPDVHGLELIMTLQTRYPDAGIVAVSATGRLPLDMAEALGATVALSKPIDPQKLVEAIAKAAPESSVWASKLRPTSEGR